MTETMLEPADYEAVAVKRIRAKTGLPAGTKVPQGDLAGRVRIQLTGHHRPNLVTDRAMVTVECWGADSGTASRNARDAWVALTSMRGEIETGEDTHPAVYVRDVQTVGGIVNRPDPDSDAERYQFTVEINARPTREVAT